MKRGSKRLGPQFSRRIHSRHVLFFVLAATLLCAAGCKKRSAPVNSASIRGISREIALAARNASNGRAEVGVRPEYAPRQPGKAQTLAADHIYITVPLTQSGVPDIAARGAIEKEIARVAAARHLQRVDRPGAPGLERFDYLWRGRRTQSIHLVTPLGSSIAPTTSPVRGPRLAVVIDDLGNDPTQADAVFRLIYPLTLSVLPHHSSSTEIAEEAHRRRYQVMLHLPVASDSGKLDEAIELHPGMDAGAVERTFDAMLETVPYAVGVNNHEGSLGTADLKLMDELMPLLHRDQLFFVDSRTTTATVAESAAHAAGVPATRRNVFLDDDESAAAIRKQFILAIHDAKEKGSALAIGHPHPETLQVLSEMLPEAQREGITLVYASELAR
ncbi:MAG: divergent polysaccharide deacetylase family protein [Candidatus Acidiferrales bacterium]